MNGPLDRNPNTGMDEGATLLLVLGALIILILFLYFFSGLDAPYYANYIAGGV